MKTASLVLATILSVGIAAAQDQKSPDLQQQKHNQNEPPPQATQPGANQTEPQSGSTNTTSNATKKKSKKRTTRQAQGTPKPDQQ